MERINAWLNPLGGQAEVTDAVLEQYLRQAGTDAKQLKDMARFAWDISPELAVHMMPRLAAYPSARHSIQELVRAHPDAVSHIPEALPLFLGDAAGAENLDPQRLSHVLTWARCSPVQALSLLCPKLYPPQPSTVQYAVGVLRTCAPELLLLYIPQIVQCIRWDSVSVRPCTL